MATPDMHGVTANAVANRPAETSARAHSRLHARRCYAPLRCASLTFTRIRGHAGDPNNELVDRRARAAALSAG
jgi:ribonuclease HI